MDLGLRDKVAIITGGSDGIGKAAALSMAQEGAAVVIVARRQEVLDQAEREILTATEGQVMSISADVTDPGTAKSIVQNTVNKFGRVDILVNNAGQSMAKPFEDVSRIDWGVRFELKVWALSSIQESLPESAKVAAVASSNVTNLGGRTRDPPPCQPRSPGPLASRSKGLSKDLGSDNTWFDSGHRA